MNKILSEGKNCVQKRKVKRLALLIDGHDYYKSFFSVAMDAKESITILGWEVEPKINLAHIEKGFPDNLRKYFNSLVKKNKNLKISIFSWKSSFYLLFGRERFSHLKWKIETPDRIRYKELRHPFLYGSHHEKIAIIDETCAFLGGMDISRKRWDTSDHRLNNPLRKDSTGECYHPIHDIQAVCTGDIVHDLLEHLKVRTKNGLKLNGESPEEIWPRINNPYIENIEAALSRTDASKGLYEIERLYLDSIKSAEKFIYIENQYFSHQGIIDELCMKLEAPIGPEILIILPPSYRGLFEKAIYTNARNKALRKLKASDFFGRLGIFFPSISWTDKSRFIIVHSKLMIVDNSFLTLGSANLNHRSLRVDSELNMSFEALGDMRVSEFIKMHLTKLLSEHLSVSISEFESILDRENSLVKAINHFNGKREKTLKAFHVTKLKWRDYFLILLAPFVDIKYSMPKVHLIVFLAAILFMGLIWMEGIE